MYMLKKYEWIEIIAVAVKIISAMISDSEKARRER
jgi:hypothetical protein